MLRSGRNPIECAFGRLKARWGILPQKVELKLETILVAIYAYFTWCNICEKNNPYIGEELLKSEIEIIACSLLSDAV